MRADGLALFIEIALCRHADLEAAIGRDDRVISRDFAVSFVRDTRLNAVANIVVALIQRTRYPYFEFSFPVQFSALF